jgi:hypothetical protein
MLFSKQSPEPKSEADDLYYSSVRSFLDTPTAYVVVTRHPTLARVHDIEVASSAPETRRSRPGLQT